ncbi:MAG: DUF1501 domain-containing protein [Planctomycetaceae bacterium]|nr:DUF1501 domain-containing protein [Planctomycetaceae bacterium]
MLKVLGSERRLCSGMSRRDLLEIGGSTFAGLGLTQLLRASTASASTSSGDGFGRAKQCIVVFLYGSPSQLETFDMKPEAPVEVRGTMQPIPSSLPGLDVCEHLPNLSRAMHLTTVLRSIHHDHPIHGVAYAMTGTPVIDVAMELSPQDPKHHPYFGSVVEFMDRQRRGGLSNVPQNVALPFPFSTQRTGEVHRAGPYAAYLGAMYNPVWTEFKGEASRGVRKTLRDMDLEIFDPYVACKPDAHFQLAATDRPADMTVDRLDRRRSLLSQFEQQRRSFDETQRTKSLDTFQNLAYSLINSRAVGDALDVRRESDSIRDLYGMSLFGQSCLAARRMLQAGTRLVSVFWDEYGLAGDAWDTHWNHFPRMLDQLMPSFDRGMSGLLFDLDQQGMLDDTLVVCVSEHGRTPKLNSAKGGGRDHWSRAYSVLLAGGGIARGRVVGSTDKIAGDVTSVPASPKDLLATMYHLLGIDPHYFLEDRGGRPISIVPETARVLHELLA